MQTFAIVNLALTVLLLGYALGNDSFGPDDQTTGALVLIVILDIALCVAVLLHG